MRYQGPGTLEVEDMERYSLVGVDSSRIDPKSLEADICILDFDTLIWVHGQQYTDGILLESIFRSMALFSEDSSFLAFADGKLFDILLKAFSITIWYFTDDFIKKDSYLFQVRNTSTRAELRTMARHSHTNVTFGALDSRQSYLEAVGCSASSHESSVMERSVPDWSDPTLSERRQHTENLQPRPQPQYLHQYYDRNYGNNRYRGRVESSEDGSGQNGGSRATGSL
ncbi:hypothetical protein KVV02_007457 [Mortierella alpina]|uniref:Uncharacterized protein n=1 Tax=Mortierella alpina TaxID=64518 RepID=A0A9P7ZZ88_MORAP|nr:hypothetical protein KVV02_007457 [Mortierella alpina]